MSSLSGGAEELEAVGAGAAKSWSMAVRSRGGTEEENSRASTEGISSWMSRVSRCVLSSDDAKTIAFPTAVCEGRRATPLPLRLAADLALRSS